MKFAMRIASILCHGFQKTHASSFFSTSATLTFGDRVSSFCGLS